MMPPTPPSVLVTIASTDRRGAEIEGSTLASRLEAVGHRADVVALNPGGVGGLSVETLGRSALSAATLRELRRRAAGSQVVVAYGSRTLPACSAALVGSGTPFVYRSIGDPRAWVRGGWHRRRTSLLFHRAAEVVALSAGAASDLAELYSLDPARVAVIPNARDAARFVPPDAEARAVARATWSLRDDEPVVVVVGSLVPEKRVDRAIEAIASLAGARLVVAGDGPERERLVHVADRLAPGRVAFVGRVDDVRTVLHAADVVVSTSATEGMPGALIEAAMCGVPAVATDVGAVADVVVDGVTGALIGHDAGSADVARLIEDVLRAGAAPGDAARRHAVARFDWSAVVPTWRELLGRVAAQRTRRQRVDSSDSR